MAVKTPKDLEKVVQQATEACVRGLAGLLQLHTDLQMIRWRLAGLEEQDEPPAKPREARRRSAAIGQRRRRSVKRT
jgi:hypothetical protein